MTRGLSDQLLSQLSDFVDHHIGLHFPQDRWHDLERGIRAVAREFGVGDAESCARWLLSAPLTNSQIEILAGSLTVGETYFFRDKRIFEILRDQILPELIRTRQGAERHLRLWSAGCCTGEEPYSIAIALDRLLPDRKPWHVTVLGTDLNPRFLARASQGVFGNWSFRDSPVWLKETYFRPIGDRFEIVPKIKEMVTFAYLNLAEDAFPSLANNTNAMDVIFCRNVLMYFSAERAGKVLTRLCRSLVDGGWFVTSPAETFPQLSSQLSPVYLEGAILYRKGEQPRTLGASLDFPTPMVAQAELPLFPDNAVFGNVPFLEQSVIPGADSPDRDESFAPAPSGSPAEAPSQVESESQAMDAEAIVSEEAKVLFERGLYSQAAERLRAYAASHPKAVRILALMARACANLGELVEALRWIEKAIAADKLDPGLHYLRATLLQEQDATDEAVAALKRALFLDPSFVLAHFALGNLALRGDKFKEANKHFSNLLNLLGAYQADDVLPQSDGLSAGRLGEIVQSLMAMEKRA